ncbi:MAG: TonB-dependent receptor [Parvularculaceae bacterium]
MTFRNSLLATLCWAALSAAAAASAMESAPSPDALQATTLRDRPLDEYIAIAQSSPYDVRPNSDFVDNYADDIGDGLFFAPGVMMNTLDLQEPRVTIRGFGLSNIHQRSTVIVLSDGAPVTDVHGVTNFSEVDLLSVDSIDIRRGGGQMRVGPDSLGGVINLVSPRGASLPTGLSGRIDGGAIFDNTPGGMAHLALAGGSKSSAIDYYAGVTGVYELGFRDNNRRTSEQFHGNIGLKPLEKLVTRFFLDIVNSTTDLAGGLDPVEAADDPGEATPAIQLGPLFPGGPVFVLVDGAGADDFSRDIREARIANKTQFRLLGHDFLLGGHYTRRQLESPQIDFVGFIDEEGSEWGARLQAERSFRFFGGEALYRFGGSYATGTLDSDRFENNFGEKGDALALTEQRSKSLTGFVQGVYSPLKMLAIDLGAKFIQVERELTDLQNDNDDRRKFTGVAARLGVLARLSEKIQAFANASRGYEPPTMNQLLAEQPDVFNGLDEQDTFSWEAGLRGSHSDWFAWDLVYFNTDVENEIITFGDTASFVDDEVLVNVDKTTHKGVEAAFDISLWPESLGRKGAALTLRNVYHYSDFRFTDAGFIGDIEGNRLAGVPTHHYRGEIRYDAPGDWFAAVNVQLSAGDYFADHVNEFSVPTDPVIGFSAGYKLGDQSELFVSGENLTNSAWVAGVTPVLSQEDAQARIFSPGARAALYGGLRVRF